MASFSQDQLNGLYNTRNVFEAKEYALKLFENAHLKKEGLFVLRIKQAKSRIKIIELVLNMKLSSEGNAVKGTRHSTRNNFWKEHHA